ncbi:hypothetical protein SAMN05216503_1165 [Polaribacter sp. KT25b]|uniref:hypothetical protein n=1 Tax=Polaribacter sp. KT25b TaxID=1855336 RepID=UPI00087B957A|nr:hypothetical protein [Polaribacter sp. KT25b]SDR85474.1 hypothetical protein SAMN05216503_1165 [Polaribacter sp. KT25b]
MFYKTISRLKFLLRATNQHGVHSPFVYDFVTKGLYKKENKVLDFKEYSALKKLSKKEKKVFSKIVSYFKIDEIYSDFKTFSSNSDNNFKILFINLIGKIKISELNTLNSKHIIVVHGIYQQKETTLKWRKIIKNKKATVSIDLYYFGLIFFRKEQVKEHFNIRV